VGPGERWPDIVVAQTGFQGAAEVYWNRSMSYRGGHNGDQVGARHKGMYSSDGAWGRGHVMRWGVDCVGAPSRPTLSTSPPSHPV
jgi:hypothetical protein